MIYLDTNFSAREGRTWLLGIVEALKDHALALSDDEGFFEVLENHIEGLSDHVVLNVVDRALKSALE